MAIFALFDRDREGLVRYLPFTMELSETDEADTTDYFARFHAELKTRLVADPAPAQAVFRRIQALGPLPEVPLDDLYKMQREAGLGATYTELTELVIAYGALESAGDLVDMDRFVTKLHEDAL